MVVFERGWCGRLVRAAERVCDLCRAWSSLIEVGYGEFMVDRSRLQVAAAIIRKGLRFLLTLRPEGKELAGYWEFPGGKIEAGESPAEALHRELREELNIEIDGIRPWRRIEHRYAERTVDLHFLEASIVSGTPRCIEVADLGWFLPQEMPDLPILPADLGIVAILKKQPGRVSQGGCGEEGPREPSCLGSPD